MSIAASVVSAIRRYDTNETGACLIRRLSVGFGIPHHEHLRSIAPVRRSDAFQHVELRRRDAVDTNEEPAHPALFDDPSERSLRCRRGDVQRQFPREGRKSAMSSRDLRRSNDPGLNKTVELGRESTLDLIIDVQPE